MEKVGKNVEVQGKSRGVEWRVRRLEYDTVSDCVSEAWQGKEPGLINYFRELLNSTNTCRHSITFTAILKLIKNNEVRFYQNEAPDSIDNDRCWFVVHYKYEFLG